MGQRSGNRFMATRAERMEMVLQFPEWFHCCEIERLAAPCARPRLHRDQRPAVCRVPMSGRSTTG
jgi:hypothetical protein